MYLNPLGNLSAHPSVKHWLISQKTKTEYFPGIPLQFTFKNLLGDPAPNDFTAAVEEFMDLTLADRQLASALVFAYYNEFLDAVDELNIASSEEVWEHVHPSSIYVERDMKSNAVYVVITAECAWEPEHGLQLVYQNGNRLTRVSAQDGNVT